jgi:hypothetical protein
VVECPPDEGDPPAPPHAVDVGPHPADRDELGRTGHVEHHHRVPRIAGPSHLIEDRTRDIRAPDAVADHHLALLETLPREQDVRVRGEPVPTGGNRDGQPGPSVLRQAVEEPAPVEPQCRPSSDRAGPADPHGLLEDALLDQLVTDEGT